MPSVKVELDEDTYEVLSMTADKKKVSIEHYVSQAAKVFSKLLQEERTAITDSSVMEAALALIDEE